MLLYISYETMAFESRMNNLYDAAIYAIDGRPLHEYYSVPGKYTFSRKSVDEFLLSLHRIFNVVFHFKKLPEEIGAYISSYLHQKVHLIFQITYTGVFVPPRWSILHVDSNRPLPLNRCIILHNRMYEDSWSPAFTIVGDLLHLIVALLPLLRKN
jgi:hypothetical protein